MKRRMAIWGVVALAAVGFGCGAEEPAGDPGAIPVSDTVTFGSDHGAAVDPGGPADLGGTPDPGGVTDPGSGALDPGAADPGAADPGGSLDVGSEDAAPPLPDIVTGDVPCVPTCTDKVCGPDGCGGICGYCAYPQVCDAAGACVEVCVPDCEGKFCGPDGCGGNCGVCEAGLDCGTDGLCYEPTCVPDCSNKFCGPDGCGGDCGVCVEPKVCVNGGCALGPCGTVTDAGECAGDVLQWCENQVDLKEDDCSKYSGYSCQYDPFQNKFTCAEQGACIPKCDGKSCGSDSCGASCGTCTNGWSCSQGTCQPEVGSDCGTIVIGECVKNVLWFCSGGKLYKEDCTAFGESCGWDSSVSAFACK